MKIAMLKLVGVGNAVCQKISFILLHGNLAQLVERLFCTHEVLGSTPKVSNEYGQEKILLNDSFKLRIVTLVFSQHNKKIVRRIQSNTGGIAEYAQANTYPQQRNSANYLRIFGRSKPK